MSDSSDADEPIGLEDAYGVETPDDNRRLYAAWATSYDSDFIATTGYVYHQRVAEIFTGDLGQEPGLVLDVGCGTGVVGRQLRRLGVSVIDGIDISPEMLDQARALTDDDGAVYRELIEADLTCAIDIESNRYDGVVSAGTFTHGHLGPQALEEIFRVAAPGARCAIGINSAHFVEFGFRDALDRFHRAGLVGPYELVTTPIYGKAATDDPDQFASVVVLTVA